MNAIRGIIPPLVTPLQHYDQLDVLALRRLIDHVIAGGVHGVFILGTTGEFASLSYRVRREVIELTCDHVKGRVPVLVGIADSAFQESVDLARFAQTQGADAVVLTPPFYFATSQPELLGYFRRIVSKISLPVFLYNMPVHTKVVIEPKTVLEASQLDHIVGLKDSSANLVYMNKVRHLLRDKQDFTFMVGPEEILAEFILTGGDGGVHGGANMFPQLYVRLYEACKRSDLDTAMNLREQVLQVSSMIYTVGQYGSSYLKGLKAALNMLGICSDVMAEPFEKFNWAEGQSIEFALENLNEILNSLPNNG